MSILDEVEGMPGSPPLNSALSAGLDNIRYGQSLTFTPYVRVVLPVDGFVFFVRYDQVSQIAASLAGTSSATLAPVTVPCSVHMSTTTEQADEDNMDFSRIVITAKQEIRPFHDNVTTVLWISEFEGVRFTIDGRKGYYQQSGLFHYQGGTVFPVMETQIIDDASDLCLSSPILSNSTPLWMTLAANISSAVWLPGFSFPLYPAWLIPDNEVPPYGVIMPRDAKGWMSAPRFDPNFSRNQLVYETVDVVLYGCSHRDAENFLDSVLGYQMTGTIFGVSNVPVIEDIPRNQSELSVRAQKKLISFGVNYYQSQARQMAEKYILECIPNITLEV